MASKQAELRHYVDLAQSASRRSTLRPRRRRHQGEAIRLLASLDFGSDGYFFLYDMRGKR
jgi:two-component system NarL family sensor kinase